MDPSFLFSGEDSGNDKVFKISLINAPFVRNTNLIPNL